MNIKKSISNHWDENVCGKDWATSFDNIDKALFEEYPYIEELAKMESSKGKDILEIGVGVGSFSCRTIKFKPKSYILYDISENTIKTASEHLKEHCGSYPFKAIVGDMEDMSMIPDKSIDRVVAIGSIHHTNTPEFAMKEISRVLRDDGDFIFMFYCKDSWRYKYAMPFLIKHGYGYTSVDEAVRKLDGDDNPIGVALSKSEVKTMCRIVGLNITNMESRQMISIVEYNILRFIPKFLHSAIEKRVGFVLYVHGNKKYNQSALFRLSHRIFRFLHKPTSYKSKKLQVQP